MYSERLCAYMFLNYQLLGNHRDDSQATAVTTSEEVRRGWQRADRVPRAWGLQQQGQLFQPDPRQLDGEAYPSSEVFILSD